MSTTSDGRGQLRLCQWNCRGLKSQYTSPLEVAHRETVDIFLLQETLLSKGSTTTTLPGYRAYHCPRVGRAGGGLTILAQPSIVCQQEQHSLSYEEGVEEQAVTICVSSLELIVYNVYRPPTADLDWRSYSVSPPQRWCWRPVILIPTTCGWVHRAPPMRQADNCTHPLRIQGTSTY